MKHVDNPILLILPSCYGLPLEDVKAIAKIVKG